MEEVAECEGQVDVENHVDGEVRGKSVYVYLYLYVFCTKNGWLSAWVEEHILASSLLQWHGYEFIAIPEQACTNKRRKGGKKVCI